MRLEKLTFETLSEIPIGESMRFELPDQDKVNSARVTIQNYNKLRKEPLSIILGQYDYNNPSVLVTKQDRVRPDGTELPPPED